MIDFWRAESVFAASFLSMDVVPFRRGSGPRQGIWDPGISTQPDGFHHLRAHGEDLRELPARGATERQGGAAGLRAADLILRRYTPRDVLGHGLRRNARVA